MPIRFLDEALNFPAFGNTPSWLQEKLPETCKPGHTFTHDVGSGALFRNSLCQGQGRFGRKASTYEMFNHERVRNHEGDALMEIKMNPLSPESRKTKPADESKLGFGKFFTDHMFTMTYQTDRGWEMRRSGPYRPICLDPTAMCLHYGLGNIRRDEGLSRTVR
jgi:hypothetical protein